MNHQYITDEIKSQLIYAISHEFSPLHTFYNNICIDSNVKSILDESILVPVLNNIINEYVVDVIRLSYYVKYKNKYAIELNFVLCGIINCKQLTIPYSVKLQIYTIVQFSTRATNIFSFLKDTQLRDGIIDHMNFIDYYFKQKYNVDHYVNSGDHCGMKHNYRKQKNEYICKIHQFDELYHVCIRTILNKEHLEITAHIIHQLNSIIIEAKKLIIYTL